MYIMLGKALKKWTFTSLRGGRKMHFDAFSIIAFCISLKSTKLPPKKKFKKNKKKEKKKKKKAKNKKTEKK